MLNKSEIKMPENFLFTNPEGVASMLSLSKREAKRVVKITTVISDFESVVSGARLFGVTKKDLLVGDWVQLQEYNYVGGLTGREMFCEVTYVKKIDEVADIDMSSFAFNILARGV